MLKRVISIICLTLVLLLPAGAFAAETADWTENLRREERCAELAQTLPERSMNGAGFFVMGTDDTHMAVFHALADRAALDLVVVNRLDIFSNLVNNFFHHEDTEAVKAVVEDLNRYYLSSMASGYWALMPRSAFTSDGIYQEANARNLYQIFYWQDVGVGTREENFRYEINKLRIDGDFAQVIITRSAELTNPEPIDGMTHSATLERDVREGYLLQKHDGEWKIANIIFENSGYFNGDGTDIMNAQGTKTNTFLMFEKAGGADVWENGFTFEDCSTEDYSPYGNYSDFIIGDLSKPQFDYDRLLYLSENMYTIAQFWNESAAASETTLENYRDYVDVEQS